MKLGILGSGRGSNFVAIQEAILQGKLSAEIAVVISDRAEAGILEAARGFGLPAIALSPSRFKTKLEPEIELELVDLLQRHAVDLVVLAGYMRVVKEPLLRAYPERIVNIHPSLLPAFRGLEAWKQALAAKVPVTGCTVHWVNAEIDGGAILAQSPVPVREDDTPDTLHHRIQEAEHELYPRVLADLAAPKN